MEKVFEINKEKCPLQIVISGWLKLHRFLNVLPEICVYSAIMINHFIQNLQIYTWCIRTRGYKCNILYKMAKCCCKLRLNRFSD